MLFRKENYHIHARTGNCSTSYRVLANSLRVVSSKRGNPPYSEYSLLGSKLSTNLLFAASKYHVTIQRQW